MSEISLFDLGKKEKVIKVFDPNNVEDFCQIKLVKKNNNEAKICFDAYNGDYKKKKDEITKEEKEKQIYSKTYINPLSKEELIKYITTYLVGELKPNIDLVVLPNEEKLSSEDKEKAYKKKLIEYGNKEKEKLSKLDIQELKKQALKIWLDVFAQVSAQDEFVELSLTYMCRDIKTGKQIFSLNKNSPNCISMLNDTRIYWQLVAAYDEFAKVEKMTPKEIREMTGQGSNFFPSMS